MQSALRQEGYITARGGCKKGDTDIGWNLHYMNWIRIIQWCVRVSVGCRAFRRELRREQATVTPWWTLPLHQCCCPPLLPAELFAALLLSQGNSRPDTLQCLSAPTQNNSTLCLLNKSWSLERKASTLVSSLPVFPNGYIFPLSSPSPPWNCIKHDLRSVSPPGP